MRAFTSGRTGIGHGKFMKAVVGVICALAMLMSGMISAQTASALTTPNPSYAPDPAFKGIQSVAVQPGVGSQPGNAPLAVSDDGSVWAWGTNDVFAAARSWAPSAFPGIYSICEGQSDCVDYLRLPTGTLGIPRSQTDWGNVLGPTRVPGISDVESVYTMAHFNFAVKKDGSLWCWGLGEYAMPGNGVKVMQAVTQPTRVPLPGDAGVKQLAVWDYSVYVVRDDGTLWTWGKNNGNGILGIGDDTAEDDTVVPTPTKVNLSNVVRVDIGNGAQVWAITADGAVYGWGKNIGYYSNSDGVHNGILGDRELYTSPVKADSLSGKKITRILPSDLGYGYSNKTCVLTEDGRVLIWDAYNLAPVPVPGLSGIKQIEKADPAKGVGYPIFALDASGTLFHWQSPEDIGEDQQKWPAPTVILNDVSNVYSGWSDYFAVKKDGTLWSWGTNTHGMLGLGEDVAESDKPMRVNFDPGVANVVMLFDGLNGNASSYITKTDGSLWVVGDSRFGFGYPNGSQENKERYFTPQQLSYPGGEPEPEPDPDFKVTASLSFIGEQAWFQCGGMCRDNPTTGDMGEYIGWKLPMKLSVTVNRPDGNSTPVSVNSAVVELPDGLSFDKSGKVRSKDVKDLLQTHMGTDTPQGWAQKIASFDVYIQYGFTYVPEFTASGTVKTSVGERHVSASIPVKIVGDDDYSLVRLVQSWYEDKDLAAQLASFSDENVPGLWYSRLTLARRKSGLSNEDQLWKYLDLAAQNDLSHAVFKDYHEAQSLLIALLDKLSKNLDGQADREVVTEFSDYFAKQVKQLAGESDDPQDVDFYSVMADLSGTAAEQFDLVNTPNTINDWFEWMRSKFIEKKVNALPKDASEKLKAETREGSGITYDVQMSKTLKSKQFIEGFIGEHGDVFSDVTDAVDVFSRLVQTGKNIKDINDTWDIIRQIRAMGDRNQLYVDILKSVSADAPSESVRTAAQNVANMIDENTDHTVNDILTKVGQTATETGSIFELLAVVNAKVPILSILSISAVESNNIFGKYTADSASLAITMSLQTDIAYGLEKYYHTSLKAFDDPADPDVKLQRARRVFYSLFMLLNVHRDGEKNAADDKFVWSSVKIGSTTDKDGKPQDLTIKSLAGRNVTILNEILGQHVTWSARRSPTADEMYEWYATWMCPVDVDVYRNGKLLATLTAKDQTVDKDGDRFVSYTVDGDPKKLMILHGRPDEYSFKARGTDDGTLVFATDVQSGGKRVTRRTSHLQVSKGALFTVGKVDVDGTYTVDVDQNGDGTVDSQVGSVQVQSDKVTVPTGISLSQKSLSLKAGETGSVGVTLDPAGATLDGVTWSSNDPSVASVDVNGRITGVKEGTATITATTFSKISATLTVTVGKGETKPDPRKDLQQAIADAKKLDSSKYTPDSWKKLQDAIGKAETVVKDDKASAQKLAEAKSDLDAALKGLVENGSSQPSTPSQPSQPTYRDGLVVVSKPNKLEYRIGEQFDGTGMVIKRQLADGSSYVLGPDQYTVSLDTSKPGKVKAYVTLDGDPSKTVSFEVTVAVSDVRVHRLYNAHSGEHFYTAGDVEYQTLVKAGWHDEGIGFTMADYGTPVYRLYRPGGKHLFTTSETERDVLKANKWLYEGVAFYVPENAKSSVYRLYNPGNGDHLLTTSANERGVVILHRWHDESVGFQAK